MAAKETIGDGGGRKYANSQFSDQNRQDAISRVSAVQKGVSCSPVSKPQRITLIPSVFKPTIAHLSLSHPLSPSFFLSFLGFEDPTKLLD